MKHKQIMARLLACAVLATALLLGSAGLGQAQPCTTVFINEIHYDNSGTDVGEAIEICGPAGTDLSNYAIELYNGSPGSTTEDRYDSDVLSGTIDDEGCGFGCVSLNYPSNGIQNGGTGCSVTEADGFALVKISPSTCIQFLNNEGTTFTAQTSLGACNGVTSTNIGVAECGTDATGNSLQLCGTARVPGTTVCYEDFTWTSPSAASMGQFNSCQTICGSGDADPTVTETDPANGTVNCLSGCDNQTITVTFSEDVTVAAGWFTISGSVSGAHTGTAVGGPQTFVITPAPASFTAGETVTVTIVANKVTDQDGTPQNMAADYVFQFRVCSTYKIHELQGTGTVTPYAGQEVSVACCITNMNNEAYADPDRFYCQEETSDYDSDPTTSEGIYVYDPTKLRSAAGAVEGDRVCITGNMQEYFGTTELYVSDAVVKKGSCSGAMPTPVNVSLPMTEAEKEAVECMVVKVVDDTIINSVYYLGRFGYFAFAEGSRLFSCTNSELPGSPQCDAIRAANEVGFLNIDDAISGSNPDPIIYPLGNLHADNGTAQTLRSGNTVYDGVAGTLHWDFNQWDIRPASYYCDADNYVLPENNPGQTNPRPAETVADPGCNVRVATFNVLDFGAYPGNSIGASSAEEYTRQLGKLIPALCGMNADIIALQEIENDGSGVGSSIAELTAQMNLVCPTWDYVTFNGGSAFPIGGVLSNAIIFQADSVIETGTAAFCSTGEFNMGSNRLPAAQTFKSIKCAATNGDEVTVVSNHFKARGPCTGCADLDCDQADGQSCWNVKRTAAANDLKNWLATNPTGNQTTNKLIAGDLNTYHKEDPIAAIEAGGYNNMILDRLGAQSYTYVYQPFWAGEIDPEGTKYAAYSGVLDHLLASDDLAGLVASVNIWHINADEDQKLDYNTEFKSEHHKVSLYAADPFRSSDHDPALVDLRLNPCVDTDSDGICDDGDFSGTAGDNPCTGGQTINCDDNCRTVSNPDQADTDSDGIGDVCDGPINTCRADCNEDGKVNTTDLGIMKTEFFRTNCAVIPCRADCNEDGKVNTTDLGIMKTEFFRTNCFQ